MTPLQNLYYAIGELAYAVARSDGDLQKEEHNAIHAIVVEELKKHNSDFDVSEIIFRILEKDKPDVETSYHWAMEQIKLNSHYLSPELKLAFLRILEKIAKAYPPVTKKENALIGRFRKDISSIQGDPVFYEKAGK